MKTKLLLTMALAFLLAGCNMISLKQGSEINVQVTSHEFSKKKRVNSTQLKVYEVSYTSSESQETQYGLVAKTPDQFSETGVTQGSELNVAPEKVALLKTVLEANLTQENASTALYPTMEEIQRGVITRVNFIKGKRYVSILANGSDFVLDANSVKELITALTRVESLNQA